MIFIDFRVIRYMEHTTTTTNHQPPTRDPGIQYSPQSGIQEAAGPLLLLLLLYVIKLHAAATHHRHHHPPALRPPILRRLWPRAGLAGSAGVLQP